MKKMSLFAGALLALALSANAQLLGLGYNGSLGGANNPGEITARLGLGPNALDLGFQMRFDNGQDDNKFAMGVSGTFLGHLHDWGAVDTYFAVGARIRKLAQDNDDIGIGFFAGFQPEVTLLEHIALSARFGLNVPVAPEIVLETFGSEVSIVAGTSFTILF